MSLVCVFFRPLKYVIFFLGNLYRDRPSFSFLPRRCSHLCIPIPALHIACLPPYYMLGRWQLLPAYAGSVALVIGLWSVGVALILLAIALLITAPLPVIRGLLGKYSVGVVDFEAEWMAQRSSAAGSTRPSLTRAVHCTWLFLAPASPPRLSAPRRRLRFGASYLVGSSPTGTA